MTPIVPISVLIAPVVIAVMAVAAMILFSGGRTARAAAHPRAASQELGYAVSAVDSTSMTPARYVGGHPDEGQPLAAPFVLLTPRDLAVFRRQDGPRAFVIPWAKVEALTTLTGAQMGMAAGSVRGLAPGALDDVPAEATFVRVRYEDERGWWQNVVFELAEAYAAEQLAVLERHFAARKPGPDPA